MRTLLVLPLADQDLNEIWEFVAQDDPKAANRIIGHIYAEVTRLREVPGLGHPRTDVSDSRYLFLSVYPYVIAYEYDDESVTIARVVHGRRDLRKIFTTR